MPGPAPKTTRRRTNIPARGEWQTAPPGWQHGPVPKPPTRVTPAARAAWVAWFGAWFAAHWAPEDLPMLRRVIRLYDKAERDEASSAEQSELRQLADSYGITKKGQQDRRWQKPKTEEPPVDAHSPELPVEDPYRHLRVVS